MADNWYVVLELEFDPPVEDEQIITTKIDERAKFWSTHFNDFKLGAQYRTWHQNIPQIKKDMIGGNNIRKQLSLDACVIVYAPVDKLLKTIGRKGNINVDEGEKISKKLKLSIDVVKKRALALGIKWDESSTATDYQVVYDKYYKTKPQGSSSFENMNQMLVTFTVANLYEFLYANTIVKNANKLPCETLRQRAKEKKQAEFYKPDSISGTGSKLCGQCDIAFKDENSKKAYDAYLDYLKRKAILDYIKSIADISGDLSSEQSDEFIGQLTQIFKDRKLSEDVLTAFYKIEKISYRTNTSENKNNDLKICRCGCINDVSNGRKVCSNCGLSLVIKCPECSTENDANIKVCKCGFKFENIDIALALCEQAEIAISSLDFSIANTYIADANQYWPNNSKAQDLKSRLTESEQRVGKEVAKMREAINKKRYVEVRNKYVSIQKKFVGYSDSVLELEFADAIKKAENLFNQAKNTRKEKEVLELCASAYEICSDLPGIKELIPAPPCVSGLIIKDNSNTKANTITWDAVSDKSIRYSVVRSTNNWIQNLTDGDIIFRGSANCYSDMDINPAVIYYYNVFAERAGVFSQGATDNIQKIINLFEITNVNITPSDASLNITWNALPLNSTAEIYEVSETGGKKLIATSQSDCYLISGLSNNHRYTYHINLAYSVDGNHKTTKGVTLSATPDCPPQPIDTLTVKSCNDDSFEAVWIDNGAIDVRLFCSPNKPKYNLGEIISISNIEKKMRPLQQNPLSARTRQQLKPNEKGAMFYHSGTETMYIVAIAIKSGTGIFGSLARASKGEKVNIKSIRPVNGQINIYVDAPMNATGFVVLHRFDQFPSDIGDSKTFRKYIPLKQYKLNSALVLDLLEAKKYYFTVFSEFKIDGEKEYSSGADYLFDNEQKENITYSIVVNKKLFGESSVVLIFEAENSTFQLPDIDVMSAVGNTPMFKNSAKLLHSIPAQQVDGCCQVRIPFPKNLAKDTYIKAFFKDEKMQAGNQLRLKLKSNYKIN